VSASLAGTDRAPNSSYISFDAAPGERNDLTIRLIEGGAYELTDPGATLSAEAGCALVDEHTARCTPPTKSSGLLVQTGDLDDRVTATNSTDIILGGPGHDTLDGGGGIDTVDGQAGDDVLIGRFPYGTLNGGPGNDLLRSDPQRPLGDPDQTILHPTRADFGGALLRCDAGTAVTPPRGDEVRRCDRVDLGGSTTPAEPALTPTTAKISFHCPTRRALGSGVCTGRVQVGGRRRGEQRFRVRAGHRSSIRVRLRRGEGTTTRYGIVISSFGRYDRGSLRLAASWTFRT
jgi:hypothetical protein